MTIVNSFAGHAVLTFWLAGTIIHATTGEDLFILVNGVCVGMFYNDDIHSSVSYDYMTGIAARALQALGAKTTTERWDFTSVVASILEAEDESDLSPDLQCLIGETDASIIEYLVQSKLHGKYGERLDDHD